MRARVGETWANECQVSSGLIGKDTTVVFRSSSASIHLLVQMSREMWQLDWNGSQFIERAADFIEELLEKWGKHKCTHTVTIVLFSRLVYRDLDRSIMTTEQLDTLKYDQEHDTHFRDLYRVVVDGERQSDRRELLLLLKREFAAYPALMEGAEEQLSNAMSAPGSPVLTGTNSSAESGNMLEAINMSLNALDAHYVDRNFVRTGLSVIAVSGGVGRFDAARNVVRLTKRRMIDDGIGCDLVCLTEPALHMTPVFRWRESPGSSAASYGYEVPRWIHQVFYVAQGTLIEGKRPTQKSGIAQLSELLAVPSTAEPHLSTDAIAERVQSGALEVHGNALSLHKCTAGECEAHDAKVWASSSRRKLSRRSSSSGGFEFARAAAVQLRRRVSSDSQRTARKRTTSESEAVTRSKTADAMAVGGSISGENLANSLSASLEKTLPVQLSPPRSRTGSLPRTRTRPQSITQSRRMMMAQLDQESSISNQSGSLGSFATEAGMSSHHSMRQGQRQQSGDLLALGSHSLGASYDSNQIGNARSNPSMRSGISHTDYMQSHPSATLGHNSSSGSLLVGKNSNTKGRVNDLGGAASGGSGFGSGRVAAGNGSSLYRERRGFSVDDDAAQTSRRSTNSVEDDRSGRDSEGRFWRASGRPQSTNNSPTRHVGFRTEYEDASASAGSLPRSFGRVHLNEQLQSVLRSKTGSMQGGNRGRSAVGGGARPGDRGGRSSGGDQGVAGGSGSASGPMVRHPYQLCEKGSSVMNQMERRWATIFPKAYQKTRDIFGNIWKSLCEPAQLPLTTPPAPSTSELNSSYNQSNYGVVHESARIGSTSSTEWDLENFERIKMQRMSQCFQFCEIGSTDAWQRDSQNTVQRGSFRPTSSSTTTSSIVAAARAASVAKKAKAAANKAAAVAVAKAEADQKTAANGKASSAASVYAEGDPSAAAETNSSSSSSNNTASVPDAAAGLTQTNGGGASAAAASASAAAAATAKAKSKAADAAAAAATAAETNSIASVATLDGVDDEDTGWMSFGNVFHHLTYIPAERKVSVTIYRPKGLPYIGDRMDYEYHLSWEQRGDWLAQHSTFQTSSLVNYKWSYVDNLMVDELRDLDQEDVNQLRFWRVRMLLLGVSKDTGGEQFKLFIQDLNRITRPSTDSSDRESLASFSSSATTQSFQSSSSGGSSSNDLTTATSFVVEQVQDEAAMPPASSYALSQAVKVDIDPRQQSDRDEWGVIHYDSHYCPDLGFQLEVQWLVATGCLVNEMVDKWMKRAEARGFRLVPVPITGVRAGRIARTPSPYRGAVNIKLAVIFPATTRDRKHFREEVLRKWDFLREDAAESSRYVHRTGDYIVELLDSDSFAWYSNHLADSGTLLRGGSRTAFRTDSTNTDDAGGGGGGGAATASIFRQFSAFCTSESELTAFWQTTGLGTNADAGAGAAGDERSPGNSKPQSKVDSNTASSTSVSPAGSIVSTTNNTSVGFQSSNSPKFGHRRTSSEHNVTGAASHSRSASDTPRSPAADVRHRGHQKSMSLGSWTP